MRRLTCLKSCILSTFLFLGFICVVLGVLAGMVAWHGYKVRQVAIASDPYSVSFDSEDRSYRLYVPANLPEGEAVPLVFVIHGGGGTAEGLERVTEGRFNELADEHGFIVIYPQGIDKQWSDGRADDFRSDAHQDGVDDVSYFKFLIGEVASQYDIDAQRIYATGISNGGFMSMRLACEASDLFAAVGIVTANMSKALGETCAPTEPIGIAIFNGTHDPLVPYDGGHVQILWQKRGAIHSTDETVAFWVEQNQCDTDPNTENLTDTDPNDQTRVTRHTYTNCAANANVILYKIDRGGHTWPGGMPYLPRFMVGRVSHDINGADEIWTFFVTQTLGLTEYSEP